MKRPAVYLAIPFILGIALAGTVAAPFLHVSVASVALLVASSFFRRHRASSNTALFLALFMAGIALYKAEAIVPKCHVSLLASEEPKRAFIRGTVTSGSTAMPERYGKKRLFFNIKTDSVRIGGAWHDVVGEVETRYACARERAFLPGDRIVLEGELFRYPVKSGVGMRCLFKTGDGYRLKVVSSGAFYEPERFAYRLRRLAADTIDRYFRPVHGGFIKAILVGDRSGLETSTCEDFMKTGTIHVISISGLHVSMLAAMLALLLKPLPTPKAPKTVAVVAVLVLYSLVAGAQAPILRSTMTFVIIAAGYLMAAETDALNSLAVAAVALLIWRPAWLFDIGFQLSFASVAGILIFTPGMKEASGSKIRNYLLQALSVSVSASLASWPIVARYFNIVSPVSLIANIVIIPVIFLIQAGAFLFLAAAPFSAGLGRALAAALSGILELLFRTSHLMASLPLAYFRTGAPPLASSLVYYLLILTLRMPVRPEAGTGLSRKAAVVLTALFLLNVSLWLPLSQRQDAFRVSFFDVGTGDSIFVELPDGRRILVDGGGRDLSGKRDAGRDVVARHLWDSSVFMIDAVLVSHFHEDHAGGLLYILKNFRVGCVIDAGCERPGRLYQEYLRIVSDKRIRRLIVSAGDEISLGGTSRILVMNPLKNGLSSDPNADSVVLKIEAVGRSVMLAGDITSDAMCRMLRDEFLLKSDVLKVPHHGGKLGEKAVAKRFFEAVSAEISIVSSGSDARSKEHIKNVISNCKSIRYDTNNVGNVVISLGPEYMKTVTFRNKD